MAVHETDTPDNITPGGDYSDSEQIKKPGAQPPGAKRLRIFSGFVSVGLVTAIFMGGLNLGGYRNAVGENAKDIAENKKEAAETRKATDKRVTDVLKQINESNEIQTKMLASIEARDEFYMRVLEQQGRSDEEFLKVIKEIRQGVQNNTKNIIHLQLDQKSSKSDNTSTFEFAYNEVKNER